MKFFNKRAFIVGGLIVSMLASSININANWYDKSIEKFKNINAISENFEPQKDLTFEEFANIFSLSATYTHAEDPIKLLEKLELISKDEFNKDSIMTRENVIKIITKYIEGSNFDKDNFLDQAKDRKIISGYPDGSLQEKENITAAQAVQMLENYRNSKKPVDGIPEYTLDKFFKPSESLGYYIDKDGKFLYYVSPINNIFNVFKKDLKTGESQQITNSTDRSLYDYFVKDNSVIYMKDFGGDENFHLFTTDKDGKEVDLTPHENTTVGVVNKLENIENELLIIMNLDNKEVFSVYKLNIITGKTEKMFDNTLGFSGFLTDNDGKLRVATFTDGVEYSYYYRETEKDEFKLVKSYDSLTNLAVIMFAEDNKTGYALSNLNTDTYSLVKVDIPTGEILEVIYSNPKADISGVSQGRKPGTLGSVYYAEDKMNFILYDKDYEKVYNELKDLLKTDSQISINTYSDDFNYFIISTSSDVNRGIIYLYDRKAKKLETLSDTNTIKSEHLANVEPVSYKSRDGLDIHGYLTLPKGKKAENLPVIVNPHGGPWMRDYWGYNPEVQFLANRGYAVLQMNFRGSTGYGKEFLKAGFKQWGLKMQDDITDGVNWLISNGIANPDKVGIYGASYGGYATLSGITTTPDLYKVAVDYVGVSNLLTFMETIPPYWESQRKMLYDRVGDPVKDLEQLKKTSPVNNVDKIKADLFIAQGANDPRVNKAESDQIVEALKARGIEVEYMVKADEGHGFSNYDNQIDFYSTMEKFLKKHLQ